VEAWRRFQYGGDLYAEQREVGSWRPHTHLQDPALFLQEEADMAGANPVYEIEHTDVPGTVLINTRYQLAMPYTVFLLGFGSA